MVCSRTLSLLFGILVAVCSVSHGLYFHLGETEKKCFMEEIPDETMVVGKYVKNNA